MEVLLLQRDFFPSSVWPSNPPCPCSCYSDSEMPTPHATFSMLPPPISVVDLLSEELLGQVCWCMSVIPALGLWRQEDQEFKFIFGRKANSEASLASMRPSLQEEEEDDQDEGPRVPTPRHLYSAHVYSTKTKPSIQAGTTTMLSTELDLSQDLLKYPSIN